MYSFFVTDENIFENEIHITNDTLNHIKNVLRMKCGDTLILKDGKNVSYLSKITKMDANTCICSILEKQNNENELPFDITIFQGLPKADKMELIIQKSVELGANKIIPINMKRSVVKLDEKKVEAKTKRWNLISKSASEQSKRDIIPEVLNPLSLKEALSLAKSMDFILFPYECAIDEAFSLNNTIKTIEKNSKIAIFIGPEGGFDLGEVNEILDANAKMVSLGKRILRTETVALMMLSVFNYIAQEKE